MAGGALGGAAIGAGIGKVAAAAPGLQEGGIVKSPTMATVGERGPEAVVPLPRDGMKVDMAQTNLLLERLIRKVDGIGVT
jgi:outer membrane lipoprotein SlyB